MRKRFENRLVTSRSCWIGVAAVAVVVGLSGDRIEVSPALAQSPLASTTSRGGGLISHFHQDPNGGPTRVILIEPLQKRMMVYHVPIDSGAIQLKSVRNFTVDLQVQEYNSGDPSTIDMEKTLQRN